MSVRIVAVFPADSEFLSRLYRVGWSNSRYTGRTLTVLSAEYGDVRHAMLDAALLPDEAVWAIESV